ncbi:hypothetical protein ACROYT_G036869 [Oculina patagonica]
MTQSDYWKEARPDWAKGKSPIEKPKVPDKPIAKGKAKDYWEEARPDWSKGKSPVAKPSTGDLKKVEEKKKYDYPTPDWATRVRSKDKASDEQDGKKSLLKAELENMFGKPKPKVKRRHSSEDMAESYRANIRKFADHRLSVRMKTKHRPSSNPVRQLLSRDDIRSEL